MNNKNGQVLVAFMLMLPLILLFLGLIIDIGLVFIEKRKIENNIKSVISYRFESDLSENDLYPALENLLNKNIDNIKNKQITLADNYIKITVNKEVAGVFPHFFKRDNYEINTTYIGYIQDGKLVISKE
ncbi:MAG: hypothetical protein GX247_03810 [Mollicutes bacterium]|jgi:hypothetical protein|nr:hypothetical protein [Mollicutes bacterium]